MCATCPAHFILLDLITIIICGKKYKYEALHYAVFSSLFLLPPSLPLGFFSNVLNPCSSLNVRNQVSHPYKMTGKIILILYF
jgi:hypothetical protein